MVAESSNAGTVTVEMFPVRPGDSVITVAVLDGMTLNDLVENLNLPADREGVIVNGVCVRPHYRLQHGDRVRVIRFISGG